LTWASAWIAVANKGRDDDTGTGGDSTVVVASIIISCISAAVSAAVGGKALIETWNSRNDDFQEDAEKEVDVKVAPLSETDEGRVTAGGGE